MQRQEVDFVYECYVLPQPASTAVTVCSEGLSLLKDSVDIVLPLIPIQPLGAPRLRLRLFRLSIAFVCVATYVVQ